MKSKALVNHAKILLKELLMQCTDDQRHQFRRMYDRSHPSEKSLEKIIDEISTEKLDHAIFQCENTIEKRGAKVSKNVGII